jgi:C1A family cysteine protease
MIYEELLMKFKEIKLSLLLTLITTNHLHADMQQTNPNEIREDIKQDKKAFLTGVNFLESRRSSALSLFNSDELKKFKDSKSLIKNCNEITEGECSDIKRKINSSTKRSNNSMFLYQESTDMLEELGETLIEFNNKENLVNLYKDFFNLNNERFKQNILLPKKLKNLTVQEIHKYLNKKMYPILSHYNKKNSRLKKINLESSWPTNSCKDAIGAIEIDQNTTDGSNKCSFDQLSNFGLLKSNNFKLRSSLPCIKNQKRRGTCTAFSTVGALEIKMYKNKKQEYNLSEQMTYFYNEIYGNFLGRYKYGLNTLRGLKKLRKKKVKIPLERIWPYNPSRYIEAFNKKTKKYPKSCNNYEGKICEDYAFQTGEEKKGWFNYSYKIPNISSPYVKIKERISFMNLLNTRGSLENAIHYLNNGEPIIVSFSVRESFSNAGEGTNYVKYKKEEKLGGHASVLVGFIYNDSLPEGAPKAKSKGYFILKNSWGKGYGDCGYVYIDFEYLAKYAYGLAAIKYSYFK